MANLSTKTGLPSFSQSITEINYFSDGGFERGVNGQTPVGWAQYNDGAVAIPVDGTGGTPNSAVTMLCSNSSPIRGLLSAVITKDAANRQGLGYSYDFTISPADKGVTTGVSFEMQTTSGFASGDVVFYVYDVTNSLLITPRNTSLTKMDNYGKFFSDFGLTSGTQYRFILHIASTNASAWQLKLDTMVNTTTKTAVPGAIVKTAPVTMTANLTNTTVTAIETQIGEWGFYEVLVSFTATPGGGNLAINLPAGRTINTTTLLSTSTATGNNIPHSSGTFADASPSVGYPLSISYNSTTSVIPLWLDDTANGVVIQNFITATTPVNPVTTGDFVKLSFAVPILEWAGASANYGPGAIREICSSTSGVWDAAATAGQTVTGPSPITGALTATRSKVVRFQSAIQPGDRFVIQYQLGAGGGFVDQDSTVWATTSTPSFNYGAYVAGFTYGSTDVTLTFNQYAAPGASYNTAPGGNWSTGYPAWQLVRYSPSAPVGFGPATATQQGLVAPRKGSYDLNPVGRVTSSAAGWVTSRAVGIYYQDQDGNHRLKFNIVGTFTGKTFTADNFTIAGVTFKNASAYYQPVSAMTAGVNPGSIVQAYATPNSGIINLQTTSGTSISGASFSGDVELDSKPTWA